MAGRGTGIRPVDGVRELAGVQVVVTEIRESFVL